MNESKASATAVKRLSRTRLGLAAVLVSGAMLPVCSWAQGTTATLGGVVTDKSGASIPNATVTITNEATHDQRVAQANGTGTFSFSALPVGDYDVKITAQGFSTFVSNKIHLDPGDQRQVRDINLAAGATQNVEVQSAADAINLDSGEQSSLISASDIKHLSVEGRDVTELLKILPGMAINNGGSGNSDNRAYDPSQVNFTGALGQYSANGTPINGIALLSDGVDVTDPGNFNAAIQNINYEQVAEVKVQTASFTADQAHGPIIINAVGKSGADKFHGSLYTYARAPQLNSVDWITKHTFQPKPGDRYVYPGFTIGGPVLIPGTNFNKSRKLTFFAGGEDYAQRNAYAYGSASSATLSALVPTAGMRAGVYSQAEIQKYLGSNYTIDPNGGPCTYSVAGILQSNIPQINVCQTAVTAPNSTALVGNNISQYVNPITQQIINSFPLPNVTSNGTYNYITTNLINNDLYQVRGRVDYNPNDRDHFFADYSIERGNAGVPQAEYYSPRGPEGGVNVPGGGIVSQAQSHLASFNYVHNFSSSLTNEFVGAGAYFKQAFVDRNFAANTKATAFNGIFNTGSKVLPQLQDYGNDGLPLDLIPDTTFGGIFAAKQVRIAGDNLTKVLGRHTIRTGVYFQEVSNPQLAPFQTTNGFITQYYIGETVGTQHATGPVGGGNGGNYLADFAEGQVFQFGQTNQTAEPNLYFFNLSGYVQDHYQITPRLTVDAGVRFEHLTPWADAHGTGIATFTPAAYAAGTNSGVAPGVQWNAINSAIPKSGRPTRAAFVDPRVGLAWDAYGSGNTVVRAGFGVYRAHDSYNNADNELTTATGQRSVTLSGPLLLTAIPAAPAAGFIADASVYAFDPHDDEEPRVLTYNIAVDQRLPGHMLMELAYVGNSADKLSNDGSTQNTTLDDLNSLPVGSLFKPQPNSRPDTASTAGMVYPVFAPGGNTGGTNNSLGNLTQSVIDSYKRFPLYNHVYVPEHNAYSNYNGLQVSLGRQDAHVRYNVNYTFSKTLGVFGTGGASTYSYPGDPFNYENDYQALPFDHRHIFNASYSYTIGNVVKNRFVGYAANGWEVSGITSYQSSGSLQAITTPNFSLGGSITVPVGTVAQATAGNTSTCQVMSITTMPQTCKVTLSNTVILGTSDVDLQPRINGIVTAVNRGANQYINAAALTAPSLGQNGAYKYGYLPGPGYFDSDLTGSKSFKVTEGSSVTFKVAAFNFLNHPIHSFTPVQLSNQQITLGAQSNGLNLNQDLLSTTAASSQGFGYAPLKVGRRIMELALRYDF